MVKTSGMEILKAPVDLLIEDPNNPRAHSRQNIAAIKGSLQRFGQVLPILVKDSDSQIVAGNGTVQAMKELGWVECTIALYDGDDNECKALSVALNRTGELASWDEVNLAKIMAELNAVDFDGIAATGFHDKAIEQIITKTKHVEFDVKEKWPVADDLTGEKEYDPNQETFLIKITEIKPEHRDAVLLAVQTAIDVYGYKANAY